MLPIYPAASQRRFLNGDIPPTYLLRGRHEGKQQLHYESIGEDLSDEKELIMQHENI
jgi:hypothetical protein